MYVLNFIVTYRMELELRFLPFKRKNFLITGMIFKSFNNFGRLWVVKMILGFRSKVLVILTKYSLKISDSPVSSENMQSFAEIIFLLEKLPLFEKYNCVYLWKYSFLAFLNIFIQTPLCFVECFRQIRQNLFSSNFVL